MTRELLQQALEALELGYDSVKAEADQFHAAMAGYKPKRHAQMDADVQQIAAAITAICAALAAPQGEAGAVYNPWRESLENCISGDNYLRASEYLSLIEDLDDLYRLRAVPTAPQGEPVAYTLSVELAYARMDSDHTGAYWIKPQDDDLDDWIPLYASPPAAPSVAEVTDEMAEAAENYLRSILNGASLPRRYMRGILHAALSEKSAAPSGLAEPPAAPEPEAVATVTSETGADISMSWWHEPALPVGTKLYLHPPAAPQGEPDAYGYASRLAVAIWKKHYTDVAPQWEPVDDLMGVLTQIDNMSSGLTRPEPQGEPFGFVTTPAIEWDRRSETVLKITRDPQPQHGFTVPLYAAPAAAPSVPASPWIACSEQLPDADIEVLAWVVGEPFWDGHCWIATYDGHGWNADEGRYALRGVTAWMDLPAEPPK